MLLLLYVPALYILWYLMAWDAKRRTTLSQTILLFYACALLSAGPLYVFTQALKQKPNCTCEMQKNRECTNPK